MEAESPHECPEDVVAFHIAPRLLWYDCAERALLTAEHEDQCPRACWWPGGGAEGAHLDEMDPRVDWPGLAGHLQRALPVWWSACRSALELGPGDGNGDGDLDREGPEEQAFLMVNGWLLHSPLEDLRSAQSWAVMGLLHLYWLDQPEHSRWTSVLWTEEGEGPSSRFVWEASAAGIDSAGPRVRIHLEAHMCSVDVDRTAVPSIPH